MPRIKKLILQTTLLSVRVNGLICVGKLLPHLDKWMIMDEILPLLQQVPSREPAVIMASIGKYKIINYYLKILLRICPIFEFSIMDLGVQVVQVTIFSNIKHLCLTKKVYKIHQT